MEIKPYKTISDYSARDVSALFNAISNGTRIFKLTKGHWRRDGKWEELHPTHAASLSEFIPVFESLLNSGLTNIATEEWLIKKGILDDISNKSD